MRTRFITIVVTAVAAVALMVTPAAAQHRGDGHGGGGRGGGGDATGGRNHAAAGGHVRSGHPSAGRAVPRPSVARQHVDQRRTVAVPVHRPHRGVRAWGLGFGAYGYASRYGYPWYGYGYPGYYSGYSSGYYGNSARDGHARLRLVGAPRDAEVYVDGYYAGVVNDFDGAFQHVELPPGAHQIEIRAPGFAPIIFDVQASGGRTITYRAQMAPSRP